MEERRRARRLRALKGAKISFNGGNSVIDCLVRNQSETGARLKVEMTVALPERFSLAIVENGELVPQRDCEVAWRTATEIGVRFL